MDLVRTNTETGAVFIDGIKGVYNAATRVAWCATDNLGMTRAEANEHALKADGAFKSGETFVMGPYSFEVKK